MPLNLIHRLLSYLRSVWNDTLSFWSSFDTPKWGCLRLILAFECSSLSYGFITVSLTYILLVHLNYIWLVKINIFTGYTWPHLVMNIFMSKSQIRYPLEIKNSPPCIMRISIKLYWHYTGSGYCHHEISTIILKFHNSKLGFHVMSLIFYC